MKQPIPLELLSIKEMEEVIPQNGAVKRTSSSLLPALRNPANETKKGEGWPVTFRHLGKNGYELTLYAANQLNRQKWLEFIDAAQQRLRARADFLNTTTISANYFSGQNKVNCVAPFGKSGQILLGTASTDFSQTADASSSMERTTASTSRIADPRRIRRQSALLTCPA